MPHEVVLTGLDGTNPLGFMAALGVLTVLSARSDPKTVGPTLSWRAESGWRPAVSGASELDELIEIIDDDRQAWATAPILAFRYVKLEKKGPKLVGGMRPSAAVLRAWLARRLDRNDSASLSHACALWSEGAYTETSGTAPTREVLRLHSVEATQDVPLSRVLLPTHFDFTSRNAQFLEQAEQIRGYVTPERMLAELSSAQGDSSAPRTLDWDTLTDIPGALAGSQSAGFRPGTEWLAFRGLSMLPVHATGHALQTTACTGRRKSGSFTWPLWTPSLSPDTTRSLIAYPRLAQIAAAERSAMGIGAVFTSKLTKKADGYAGVFAPSAPT